MRETVVSIQGAADKRSLLVYLDSPSTHDDASDIIPLLLEAGKMPPLDTSDNVTAYGTMVLDALSGHPAIKQELGQMFGIVEPERLALKFLIRTPVGERLRWEALHSGPPKTRFLAITDMCTISRVTLTNVSAGLRAFTWPLRMVAFLSAAGVRAEAEFEKIWPQIVAAREQEPKLQLECTVYIGEQELLERCEKRISEGDLKDKGITVKPIPGTAAEIGTLLRDTPIQFLHFFCHGIERAGVQGLSLATINDHDKNEANGNSAASSIFLSVDALSNALALNPNVWITVLNSCSGADASVVRQLYSMALTVTKKGCPYTVGMAEPIDTVAATTFSEAFYGELFGIVKQGLAGEAADAPLALDLSPAVISPRKIIHERCCNEPGDSFGRWLLPLLYERTLRPLVVQRLEPAMAKRIQDIARQLRVQPQDTPTAVRDKILEILDDEPVVPEKFRPDRYGAFG
jgi:hypothetical protein